MPPPNDRTSSEALTRLRHLLAQPAPNGLPRLFRHYPFVLSDQVPLRVDSPGTITFCRDFSDEPDLVLFNRSGHAYNTFEIKTGLKVRPSGRRIIYLSDDTPAVIRAIKHFIRSRGLVANVLLHPTQTLIVTHHNQAFSISGLDQSSVIHLIESIKQLSLTERLENLRLCEYEDILEQLTQTPDLNLCPLIYAFSSTTQWCVIPSYLDPTTSVKLSFEPDVIKNVNGWSSMFQTRLGDGTERFHIPRERTGFGIWVKEAQVVQYSLQNIERPFLCYTVRSDDVDALTLVLDPNASFILAVFDCRTGMFIHRWNPRPDAPMFHGNQLLLGCRQLWPTRMPTPYIDPLVAASTENDLLMSATTMSLGSEPECLSGATQIAVRLLESLGPSLDPNLEAVQNDTSRKGILPSKEELVVLPNAALVAYGVRCARRVFPLVTLIDWSSHEDTFQEIEWVLQYAAKAAAQTVDSLPKVSNNVSRIAWSLRPIGFDPLNTTNQARFALLAIAAVGDAASVYLQGSRGTATRRHIVDLVHDVQSHARDALWNRMREDQWVEMRHDFELLKRRSSDEYWADDTPVPLQIFLLQYELTGTDDIDQRHESIFSSSSQVDACLKEYLRRNASALDSLAPRQFEELIASIWRDLGWDVALTARTRDGGKDVVAVQDRPAKAQYLIECKHWQQKVGVEVVRALYGVLEDEGATKAILVSTSGFTSEARKFVDRHSWRLEARDYAGILEWLDSCDNAQADRSVVSRAPEKEI